ncbi:LOW QUALITY PROTEIN: baculoviral IAP repeat-containing protein 1 [Rhineura floridana]|uniref:LOW QUALITY PROTEIN: baculoviral IAP repeat-containing protein 1 n=1 Tax=Rhineura floridana TaxID=261503 RepID=UPI002AC872D0|nr:LOW QUALITY PROTEIN: baculoviral IAP repeat-containing protein 1 [Rhineura floridana]
MESISEAGPLWEIQDRQKEIFHIAHRKLNDGIQYHEMWQGPLTDSFSLENSPSDGKQRHLVSARRNRMFVEMTTQGTSAEGPSSHIAELDISSYSHPNVDFSMLAEEMENEYQEIRRQLQRGFNSTMRNEAKRLKTFLFQPGNSRSAWAPQEMAAGGFYHTGVKTAIQCYCCGLVLLARKMSISPYTEHKRHWPVCEFILGKEVGNISKYEVRVQNLGEDLTDIKMRFKDVKVRLESFACWPFYAPETQPALLANAGFFFIGIKDTVQCFACSGCLGNWEEGDDPWKEHAKVCEFLQKEKSKDEIKEYIQSYCGFVGVTGKQFATSYQKILPSNTGDSEPGILNIYEDEDIRLDSFKTWPQDAHADATTLAKAGYFYTGKKDIVQCFSCAGRLTNWKETDDPWKEHAKFSPHCKLSDAGRKTSVENPQRQAETEAWLQTQLMDCSLKEREAPHYAMTNKAFEEHEWLQGQLSGTYSDINFRKMFSFGDSTHFAIDLKLLYGDLAIVSKDINNLPLQKLTLPEVLESFHSITVVEGEAGSGKTALLRKIAILWASGCCPILSRFKFVFYLPLNSRRRDQSLADLICNQVVGLKGLLTEDSLKNVCQQLENQALFLLDDYDEMTAVPRVIEDLIQKNYLNKHCLVIAVRTNRIGKIRHYANIILSIAEFPLSSTLYLLKKLFSHDTAFLEEFYIQMAMEEPIQSIFKTPLFAVAVAAYWAQYPAGDTLIHLVILKAYLLYNSLKYPQESERLKTTVSTCGELALRGLFKSNFEFSEEDLSEVAVNGDDALWFGLLSKFTAQRLRPLYTFFHLSFQEFLAGLRMSELLSSDVQADVERGLQYMQQINTFVKISGRYQYILIYACSEPSKAVPQIISHLLNLLSCKASFESQLENDTYLQQTPKLQLMQQQALFLSFGLLPEMYHIKFTEAVLTLTTKLAYQSHMVPACVPILSQFLTGKEFSLDLFASKSDFISRFFLDYPESLFLPSRFEVCFLGQEKNTDMSLLESCYSHLGVPVVDQEYAPAFTLLSNVTQQLKEDIDFKNSFRTLFPRQLPDSKISPFVHIEGHEKIPYLKFDASYVHLFQDLDLQNLVVLFSVFDRIELRLKNCKGLIESIKPAIEQNLDSFRICSIHDTDLNVIEENLLLSMASLESLEIKGKTSIPETLLVNLDKYTFLKELSLDLPDHQNVFDIIPEDFKNLHNMEKLLIYNVQFKNNSPRLVEFVRRFQNLSVFHLKNSDFSDVGALLGAMSSCKMLTDIQFTGLHFRDADLISLVAALSNFTALRVLNLTRLNFINKEACIALAAAVGSLVNLEEIVLPIGEGISHMAKLIVQQCLRFPILQRLQFSECLSDEGLLEIANVAAEGGFQKLEFLCLSVNHNITENSWRNFFQTLTNMPNLHYVDFSRLFTHQIKCQAATVKSFTQCVSRLHNLKTISMLGWLFDEEDLKMFNVMKEQHPQSKELSLTWKWILPVAPIVNE